jgi:hypothetical protein
MTDGLFNELSDCFVTVLFFFNPLCFQHLTHLLRSQLAAIYGHLLCARIPLESSRIGQHTSLLKGYRASILGLANYPSLVWFFCLSLYNP